MDLGGSKERKNDLKPSLIFYQAKFQPELKKKAQPTAFKYGLCTTTLLSFCSVGIPHVKHLHSWAQTVI